MKMKYDDGNNDNNERLLMTVFYTIEMRNISY